MTDHASSKLDIVVVGAGLVGLTTAWVLKNLGGHNVTLLEKSASLGKGGADIQVSPNAVRCLDRIGLLQHIRRVGTSISLVEFRNWHSMELMARSLLNPRGDYGSLMIRRDDLIEMLYEQALKSGVKIVFDTEIVQIDDDAPSVTSRRGTTFQGDLIVAAEGVRSQIRSLLFSDRDTQPVLTDTVCFQLCVPFNIMSKDPDTLAMWNDHKGVGVQFGDGKYITSWRNDYRQAFYIIFSERHYDKPVAIDDWTRKGDLDELLRLYSDFPLAIKTLIRNVDHCEKWRIVDAVNGADWTSVSGKVVLVGDSIHAMPPHAAQGYSQGIEDAASLSVFLDHLQNPAQLATLTQAWADLREPRASLIQTTARANLAGFTLPDGPAQAARDARLKERASVEVDEELWKQDVPSIEAAAKPGGEFYRWLYFYDVIEEASKLALSLDTTT